MNSHLPSWIINAEAPHKIVNLADMFLVRLGHEEGFEQPLAVVDLVNVAELFQRCDAFLHNWYLSRAVINRSNANGAGVTSVDGALVILHGDKLAFVVKDRPILLEELSDGVVYGRIKMEKIKFTA